MSDVLTLVVFTCWLGSTQVDFQGDVALATKKEKQKKVGCLPNFDSDRDWSEKREIQKIGTEVGEQYKNSTF